MLWNRLRLVAVAALAMGIASGGAIVYVRGAQEPVSKVEPAVSKRAASTTAQNPRRKDADKAPQGPPATATPASLRAQQLAARKANLVYEIAVRNHQLAGIAVEEYEDFIYPRELAAAEHQIELAKAEVSRADDDFKKADTSPEKSGRSTAKKISAELVLKRSQYSLEVAEATRKVLTDFTRDKTIKELKSKIEKAGSEELAAKAKWQLELTEEKKLERELKGTTK